MKKIAFTHTAAAWDKAFFQKAMKGSAYSRMINETAKKGWVVSIGEAEPHDGRRDCWEIVECDGRRGKYFLGFKNTVWPSGGIPLFKMLPKEFGSFKEVEQAIEKAGGLGSLLPKDYIEIKY